MARMTYLPGELLFGRPVPAWKRAMDIAGSLFGLIVLSPLFLVIAAYTKMVSPGPVFFKQKRAGYRLQQFDMWKFRTMIINADTSGHKEYVTELIKNDTPMSKLETDPQIIPLGRILRSFGLDELPQLINILRGDMSLVGPRPDPVYVVSNYHLWHHARYDVLPGITGLWQVRGKNRTTFAQMMRFDIAYVRKLSFWRDVKILIQTVPAVIVQVRDCLFTAPSRASSPEITPEPGQPTILRPRLHAPVKSPLMSRANPAVRLNPLNTARIQEPTSTANTIDTSRAISELPRSATISHGTE